MKTLELSGDKRRCLWCGKTSDHPLSITLQMGKQTCATVVCSPDHEAAVRKTFRYVKKMFPVFVVGLALSMALVFIGKGTFLTWLGVFVMGITFILCPFVTPQTTEWLGLKKSFIVGRIGGLVICVTAVLSTTLPDKNPVHVRSKQEATKAALAWVSLIDAEKYSESWEQSAAPFSNAITATKWADMVKPIRAPMGKPVLRRTISQEYTTSLPGGQTGEFVVIQFKTDFENKKGAIETITPMMENGQWKVSGYYIK